MNEINIMLSIYDENFIDRIIIYFFFLLIQV
jgi:hypothetical protein